MCTPWPLRCVKPSLGCNAITQRRSTPRQVDLHRIACWWTVRREKGSQVFMHGSRQRQHQQPGVTALPDSLEFVDLATNVLRILRRIPGTLHLKFFAVARPRCTGLIHGALKGNDIAVAVVEDTSLGMVQSTVSSRMVGAPCVVQGQSDADCE